MEMFIIIVFGYISDVRTHFTKICDINWIFIHQKHSNRDLHFY